MGEAASQLSDEGTSLRSEGAAMEEEMGEGAVARGLAEGASRKRRNDATTLTLGADRGASKAKTSTKPKFRTIKETHIIRQLLC